MKEELLTTRQVADRLQVNPGTLANWRMWNRGPAYKKVGRNIRYSAEDVKLWEEKFRQETADSGSQKTRVRPERSTPRGSARAPRRISG